MKKGTVMSIHPKWGKKRDCHDCGSKFYDMNKSNPICPKCGTAFDIQASLNKIKSKEYTDNMDNVDLVVTAFDDDFTNFDSEGDFDTKPIQH